MSLPLPTRRYGRERALAALLFLTCLGMGALAPRFLTPANGMEVVRSAFEVGLLALALTPVIIAGGIDLSVGSMIGLCAVVLGLGWRAGLPIEAAALAAVAAGALAGLGNGLLVAHAGIPPLIVTLATLAVYRGLAFGLSRGQDVHGFPEGFLALGQGYLFAWIPLQVIVLALAAAGIGLYLSRTAGGRALYAVGAGEGAAYLSGIDVHGVRRDTYLLAGICAGVAAVLYAARVSTARADAGLGYELAAITAVLLGGTRITGGEGTIGGTLLGLLLLAVLQSGLSFARVPADRQAVLLGALLILAVLTDRVSLRGRQGDKETRRLGD
jgi:rhamnose transport system permease protein